MKKYLYLKEVAWAETWIDGGEIPISLASTYISQERNGTMTPDENLIHKSNVDIPSLNIDGGGMLIEKSSNISIINSNLGSVEIKDSSGVSITKSTQHKKRIPDIVNADYYHEDGLVLCFCNSFSEDIAKRLDKKVCIRILSMEKLLKEVNKQLGLKGLMKNCDYTTGHQRNHFLKSKDDSWQDEFRIFWRGAKKNCWVKVPKGTAEFIAKFED